MITLLALILMTILAQVTLMIILSVMLAYKLNDDSTTRLLMQTIILLDKVGERKGGRGEYSFLSCTIDLFILFFTGQLLVFDSYLMFT